MPPKKKDASCCQLNILLHHGLSAVPDKTKKVWTKSKEKISSWQFFSSVASAVKISKLSNSGSAWSAQKTSQYSLLKDSNSNLFIKWRHTNRYFLSIPWRVLIIIRTLHILIFTVYNSVYWLYTPQGRVLIQSILCRASKMLMTEIWLDKQLFRQCGKALTIIPWKTPDL